MASKRISDNLDYGEFSKKLRNSKKSKINETLKKIKPEEYDFAATSSQGDFSLDSMNFIENGGNQRLEAISEETRVSKDVGESKESIIARLKYSITTGNVEKIGSIIRKAKKSNQLSEKDLLHVARTSEKPQTSISSFVENVEMADLRGLKDLMIGRFFVDTIPAPQIFSNYQEPMAQPICPPIIARPVQTPQTIKIERLVQNPLLGVHVIPPIDPFPMVNLNMFYEKHSLIGDCASSQLSDIMRKIFSTLLTPNYEIWLYSYRYNTTRQTDRHFRALPKEVVEVLIDFCIDVCGGYLPKHLLYGEDLDSNDEFLRKLMVPDTQIEIERRLCARSSIKQIVQHAISESLRQLRTYHYDVSSQSLGACKHRKLCSTHIPWEMVRKAREQLRLEGKDEDQFVLEDLMPGNIGEVQEQ